VTVRDPREGLRRLRRLRRRGVGYGKARLHRYSIRGSRPRATFVAIRDNLDRIGIATWSDIDWGMPFLDLGGYPPEIRKPSAWYGPELDADRDWIEALSDAEIERAVQGTIERLENPERELVSLRKQDFPLPTLASSLARILEEVQVGRGFVLIRRLPVERWSKLELPDVGGSKEGTLALTIVPPEGSLQAQETDDIAGVGVVSLAFVRLVQPRRLGIAEVLDVPEHVSFRVLRP